MYTKIALAIAFSPRIEALITEVKRLVLLFDSELVLIHVGIKTPELEKKLDDLLQRHGCDRLRIKVLWKEGKPVKMILKACKEENVDLLVAGALKREGLFKYYMGSVGRKIIRKAPCSVLTLIEPKVETSEFSKVVINGTQLEITPVVIEQGLEFSKTVKADQVSILNEIKMYGLQMGTASEDSEDEIAQTRRQLVQNEIDYVEQILQKLDKGNLRINIKVTGGKWAVELARFCEKTDADLLVVGDERKLNFFDRIFPHDLEELLSTLPCNLLIVKK
ncbi:universal stress protein [Algoriphagus zhangzhouensis]|uniref:Nucleotide-binding universal stress protein, UspA family n=1 Tax=Algoriphagus zhangzhouensis TaxID=1073327 RepID=A0A1M7ZGM6_9BACT|nr:universal stress protein [Algoriphagus zhangzhouensis]TDY44882.1 nucleotide-binding universal stress UspA family protein [Algoriphagus zhangzhouensis]SHO63826.1 Nucleotide-binding universal stress protein, UspA family [Algoriphagus zhangzhouensis]